MVRKSLCYHFLAQCDSFIDADFARIGASDLAIYYYLHARSYVEYSVDELGFTAFFLSKKKGKGQSETAQRVNFAELSALTVKSVSVNLFTKDVNICINVKNQYLDRYPRATMHFNVYGVQDHSKLVDSILAEFALHSVGRMPQ